MKHNYLIPIILLAAACTPRYEWTRGDTPVGEIELARNQCAEESMAYNFLDGANQSTRVITSRGERYSNLMPNTAAREFSLFNDCMYAKGYTQTRVDEDGGNNGAN